MACSAAACRADRCCRSATSPRRRRWRGGGAWRETDAGAREPVDFPHDGRQPSWAIPGPELISIQRHVAARTIEATMNMDLVAGVSSITDAVIAAAPAGPSENERRSARFTILAEARAPNGTMARGFVCGQDPYGATARVAVEAAVRLGTGSVPVGAVPASLAFDPANFLNALEPFGITWEVA